jgi:pimeloyl-ACP methyl ester carboxylesterase
VSDVLLDHDEYGTPDGPVLVLLAGLGAQRHWWPPGLVALLAEEHRVVVPDNRDVGGSPRMDHLGLAGAGLEALQRGEQVDPPYTLADMAGDVIGLLDHLEVDRAHVVGASMGGMVAQHVALGWPDRVASLTTIMSTTGGADIPAGDPQVLALLLDEPPIHSEDAYVEAATAASKLSANSHLFDEEDARRRHRLSYRAGLNPAASGRQLLATLLDGDRTERLATLDVPTLVIHGEVDPMLRVEAAHATAAAIPGAQLLVLPDVGHELPRAIHREVADAIAAHVAGADAAAP